jgi:osmotically-inducible protein OsmY
MIRRGLFHPSRVFVVWAVAAFLAIAASVAPPAFADESQDEANQQLVSRVRLTLIDKFGADALGVDVAAASGNVVLAGKVEKRSTHELLSEVAQSVTGVKDVTNRVALAEPANQPTEKAGQIAAEGEREVKDASIELKLRLALIDKLGRDGFRIGTDAASGVVTLEFPAKMTRERRDQAIAVAEKVDGVKKVISIDK